jgi:hypothetical protein
VFLQPGKVCFAASTANRNSSTRPNAFNLSDITNKAEISPARFVELESLGYWLATTKFRKCPRGISQHGQFGMIIRLSESPAVFPQICIYFKSFLILFINDIEVS